MTGSNSELIRARIFWCRYLGCRCCCKRFDIDSVADEVFMEYSPGDCTELLICTEMDGKLTSAAAIHAFVLGYPSGINCEVCFNYPQTSGPQPSAHYLNLYLLLMCGADPNLRLGSDFLQPAVTDQTPLHLVASRLQRGRKRLVNAASSKPWWDWISFFTYWYTHNFRSLRARDLGYVGSNGSDYEYLHNHPIDVCGCASYYFRKMSIGYCYYCCCYPPMPYDLVTTTNIHAAELLIHYGADASLRDSNGRTPLEIIKDVDIRGRLQQAVDAVAAGRASREKEVDAETMPMIVAAKEDYEVQVGISNIPPHTPALAFGPVVRLTPHPCDDVGSVQNNA
eukprot:gene26351-34986_t